MWHEPEASGLPSRSEVGTSIAFHRTRTATCSSRSGAPPRGAPGRPGPREVVPADRAERIQNLPAEEQSRAEAALHRARIDLVERHTTPGDLRALVALVPGPEERMPRQGLGQV